MNTALHVHAVAAALCCLGGWWLLSRRRVAGRARSLISDAVPAAPGAGIAEGAGGRPSSVPRPPHDRAVLWGLACSAVGLGLSVAGTSPLPVVLSLILAPFLMRRCRRRERLLAADRRRDAVIAFCAALAGEVRAGRQPEQALQTAGVTGLGPVVAALPSLARRGDDIAGALRRAAGVPGAEGLGGVAACWQVAVDGGASLASGLDRVAQSLRSERDQREELRSQLAGPRATAFVLAALPAAGLLLGTAMGADPLHVLLHQPAGLLCLLLGGALEAAGLSWTAAIIRSAERSAT
ncbi:type II secretion system F family protein [Streptomyces sp. SM12]|uniref:type II secretion system F family protein n=1 Tax=Streptomyces sp. SM12 TaxID=1071602 RepID=UPI00215624A3|nr:type II secretion system F family protein [Streptomyces sp. SM12]